MGPKPVILVITGIGAAIGLALIISGSLVLTTDLMKLARDACKAKDHPLIGPVLRPVFEEACEKGKFWTAACSLGIIAGVFQIMALALAFLDKVKVWGGLIIFVCLLAMVSVGIVIAKDGFEEGAPSESTAFAVIAILDVVYTLGACIAVFILTRSK